MKEKIMDIEERNYATKKFFVMTLFAWLLVFLLFNVAAGILGMLMTLIQMGMKKFGLVIK